MDYIPFDSWNTAYKSKFGAVAANDSIFFRILIPRGEGADRAELVVASEGGDPSVYGMFWAGTENGFEWWDVTFTPQQTGLYFYYFQFTGACGRKYVSKTAQGKGEIVCSNVKVWQQTVFSPGFKTPGWLKGGVIYQIFPDRFRNSGEKKENVPAGRIFCSDWNKIPEFRPTGEGKILNNDYYGGDLKGITEKLPYLKELSVTCIYLNPVFEAHSNHRYDTADYQKVDPLLGTEEDFKNLCLKAEKLGIRIILDGVFSHTGDDSVYFNKYNRYNSTGAFNSKESPYFSWYKFKKWPDDYACWWNILILPEVNEEDPEFIDFICGRDGVLEKWQKGGAAGYRLDVADELPDLFLDALRERVKAEDESAVIIGEVWEDASNKSSYGQRRHYLLGNQLDSVMNYPFYHAIAAFLQGGDAGHLNNTVMTILEHYPKPVVDLLMNHLGTHDTERLLTKLAGEPVNGRDREWQAKQKLDADQKAHGKKLLRLATALQFTLPGIPSVYYGDEAGMEGYRDPFNRCSYPWGNEDMEILGWYQKLGKVRLECEALKEGGLKTLYASKGVYVYERKGERSTLLCGVNRNDFEVCVDVGRFWDASKAYIGKKSKNGNVSIPPLDLCILLSEG